MAPVILETGEETTVAEDQAALDAIDITAGWPV